MARGLAARVSKPPSARVGAISSGLRLVMLAVALSVTLGAGGALAAGTPPKVNSVGKAAPAKALAVDTLSAREIVASSAKIGTLEAKRIVLKDAGGHPRIVLEVEGDAPRIQLLTPQGAVAAAVQESPSLDGGSVYLYDLTNAPAKAAAPTKVISATSWQLKQDDFVPVFATAYYNTSMRLAADIRQTMCQVTRDWGAVGPGRAWQANVDTSLSDDWAKHYASSGHFDLPADAVQAEFEEAARTIVRYIGAVLMDEPLTIRLFVAGDPIATYRDGRLEMRGE